MVIHITEKPEKLLKGAAVTSFIVAIVLLCIKFAAYVMTGSAAILSDAAESIINVLAAGFAFFSMMISFKPPDDEHPYGHGKVEFISAAFEGGAIIVAAVWIIYKAVDELIRGPTFHKLDVGIWLVVVSIVINAVLGGALLALGKRNKSLILEADGRHVLTDVATSTGVLAGLIIMYYTGWFYLDAVIAIAAALLIIRTGSKLLKRAEGGMMDASNPDEDAKIKEILDGYQSEYICGYHKLRHRHSGKICYVDFHLMFPRDLPIAKAHEIATSLEGRIAGALGDAGVMAHIEPCHDSTCLRCRQFVIGGVNEAIQLEQPTRGCK